MGADEQLRMSMCMSTGMSADGQLRMGPDMGADEQMRMRTGMSADEQLRMRTDTSADQQLCQTTDMSDDEQLRIRAAKKLHKQLHSQQPNSQVLSIHCLVEVVASTVGCLGHVLEAATHTCVKCTMSTGLSHCLHACKHITFSAPPNPPHYTSSHSKSASGKACISKPYAHRPGLHTSTQTRVSH